MRGLWLALVFTLVAQPALAGVTAHKIRVGSLTREYSVYMPRKAQRPMPVVFALHGGGGKPSSMNVGFDQLAERYGFAVVYPEGVDKHWADGRDSDFVKEHPEVNDVAFLTAVMDALVAKGADARRMYFTGISNGAIMSYRMACDMAGRVAAIAPVAGALPVDLDCKPSAPVPVLAINGTDDNYVFFNGGPVGKDGDGRGYSRPVMDTIGFWEAADGCGGETVVKAWPKIEPKDPTSIVSVQKPGCPVQLLRVEGGGHTWPGSTLLWQKLLSFTVGMTSKQMDATQVIWGFFADKRR